MDALFYTLLSIQDYEVKLSRLDHHLLRLLAESRDRKADPGSCGDGTYLEYYLAQGLDFCQPWVR